MRRSSPELTSKEEKGGENEYWSTTEIRPCGDPEEILPVRDFKLREYAETESEDTVTDYAVDSLFQFNVKLLHHNDNCCPWTSDCPIGQAGETRNEEECKSLSPFRPVERIIGIVRRLWDKHNIRIPLVFESMGC
jgi:hypothetical protein